MFEQKQDREANVGRAIFMVLFFLFISSFAGNPDSSIRNNAHFEAPPDLHTQVAVLSDAVQLQALNVAAPFVKFYFKLFNHGYNSIAENRIIYHKIQFLKKIELLLKPVILQRFYCLYHTLDGDDFPDLS